MLRNALTASFAAAALAACGPVTSVDTVDSDLEQAAVNVYHSTWKGGSGAASFGDHLSGGYVDVWQYNATTAAAYINTWEIDPASEVCESFTYFECTLWNEETGECLESQEFTYPYCYYTRYSYTYGYGELTGASIQSTPSRFRVRGNTTSSSFYGTTCTIDYGAGIYECTDGAAVGTIDVSWAKDGLYSSFHNGVSQYTYGKYTHRTTGQYRSSSAVASGSVLGTSFSEVNGWMSSNKGAAISKDVYAN